MLRQRFGWYGSRSCLWGAGFRISGCECSGGGRVRVNYWEVVMSDYSKMSKPGKVYDSRAAWTEVLRKEQERQMTQTCLTNTNYPDNPSR